jgi:hypothetical protein
MKKAWMMFFVLAIAALPAAAANITVSAPTAGAALEIGKSLPITWTFAGLPASTKVSIFLCQGSIKLGNIVQNLAIGSAGQGAFDWSAGAYIGGTAAAGSDFFIKIRTGDGSVTGKSGLFTLAAKPGNTTDPVALPAPVRTVPKLGQTPPHCMAITSPKAGQIADPFNFININWTKYGNLDPKVSITLLRPGKGAHLPGVTLAASTENDGAFSQDLTPLMPVPGVYFVRVRTLDGKCEATSDQFTVKETGSIELLSPLGGEVWENGSSHAVTWKRTGNIQKVDILFNRASSAYKTLAKGIDAKLGTVTCVFEKASWEQGNPCHYNLFIVHSSGGGSSNISGCITLTGNPDLAVSASFSPTMANVGTNLTFAIKIENKGVVRSHACQGDFYVNGAVDQAFQVPAIDPGATATASIIWKLACPAAVKIIIDPGQVNVEPDKANNAWEKPLCTN